MRRKFGILLILLCLGLAVNLQVAAAQSGVNWTARFYNNRFLQDPAAVVRQDSAIGFNWGSGAPAVGVNTDNFSARWTGIASFTAGTYRFYAQADDAVKITLNDTQVILSTMDAPRPGQLLTADVSLPTGQIKVQVDFQEFGGDASIYVNWVNLATNPTGPNFPSQQPASGPWTAQYYANPTLSGTPTLIQTESDPSHDWGTGSPVASIPADNFSARWTSVQTLAGGTYQISVKADDGVRVSVDGVVYINEFHLASAQTYIATLTLAAGQHTFMIEYFESGGVAFLAFNLASPTPSNPPPANTGATATITAYRLNVRDAPNAYTGNVIVKVSQRDVYAVVGRNADSSWWQINVNGTVGWVNGNFVSVTNAQNVPQTTTVTPGKPGSAPPPVTTTSCPGSPAPRLTVGKYGRVTPGGANNLRSAPGVTNALMGKIPSGGLFLVLSGPQCANNLTWWQVNYNGVIAWTAEGSAGVYWLEPA